MVVKTAGRFAGQISDDSLLISHCLIHRLLQVIISLLVGVQVLGFKSGLPTSGNLLRRILPVFSLVVLFGAAGVRVPRCLRFSFRQEVSDCCPVDIPVSRVI